VKGWLVIGITFCAPVLAAKIVFKDTCPVRAMPSVNASTVCRRDDGAGVLNYKKANDSFYFVEMEGCRGFVAGRCLKVADQVGPAAKTADRRPSRERDRETNEPSRDPASARLGKFFRVGPLVSAGLMLGKPGTSAATTNGTDFGGGLSIGFSVSQRVRVTLIPLIEMMKLSRTLNGTGVIADPNPASYDQKMTFVGAAAFGGIKLSGSKVFGEVQDWWFDLGTELLTPISATQTDNFGNEIKFTSTDRLAFLVLGPSGDFSVAQSTILSAYLQLLYNLGSRNGAQLFGGRLRIALMFDL